MSKFIQLTGDGNYGLYALDDEGVVWYYARHSRRIGKDGMPTDIFDDDATWEEIRCWEPLAVQRGWLGWSPTPAEQAQAEVEEMLR